MKANWTIDATLENATEAQAEAFFDVLVALANAMGLQVGGGIAQEVDDGSISEFTQGSVQ